MTNSHTGWFGLTPGPPAPRPGEASVLANTPRSPHLQGAGRHPEQLWWEEAAGEEEPGRRTGQGHWSPPACGRLWPGPRSGPEGAAVRLGGDLLGASAGESLRELEAVPNAARTPGRNPGTPPARPSGTKEEILSGPSPAPRALPDSASHGHPFLLALSTHRRRGHKAERLTKHESGKTMGKHTTSSKASSSCINQTRKKSESSSPNSVRSIKGRVVFFPPAFPNVL